jgi:transcriptional regulator with XRE-family HTH domain
VPRPENPQPALGAAVRAIRDERDLKQLDVAEDASVTVAHLSKIETGKVNPTWSTVQAIANALGVTITDLAARSEDSTS